MYLFENVVYKTDDEKTVLILGDSQVQHGLDPEKITNSVNTAQAAEPVLISYLKLKYIYKHNKNIKVIIAPYSPLHFTHTFDDMLDDKVYSSEIYNRSIYLFRIEDIKEFNADRINYLENFIRYKLILNVNLLKESLESLFKDGYKPGMPFIGGFVRNSNDSAEDKYDIEKYIDDRFEGYTEARGLTDTQYYDSIASFTSKNGLELYLIGMPLLSAFYKKVPSEVHDYMNDKLNNLLHSYKNIKYLPCFNIIEDSLFVDYGHLTGKGAELCSEYVIDRLIK